MNDRVQRIEQELSALVEEMGRSRFGRRTWGGGVELHVELEADATGRWRTTGRDLLEQVEQALAEAAAVASPVQPGRVFCHRCEAASCAHSVPPRSVEVFAGYGQTGIPAWAELQQVLLEARHPEVESLFAARRAIVSHVQAGRELKSRQLAAFGRSSKSYDVLGQVVAGYYRGRRQPARRRAGRAGDASHSSSGERIALTFQAVEHRGARGEVRLDLNVIGRTENGEDAVPVLEEQLGERLAAPVRKAREALHALRDRLRDRKVLRDRKLRSQVLGRVPGVLRKLARDLGAGERRQARRTGHAEERRRQSRPVQPAVREASRSTPERTLYDEKEGTMIVLGRRNRVHVFTPDGRLVTSLSMEPDAVERRLRLERWRRASREEREALRTSLQREDGASE